MMGDKNSPNPARDKNKSNKNPRNAMPRNQALLPLAFSVDVVDILSHRVSCLPSFLGIVLWYMCLSSSDLAVLFFGGWGRIRG